MDVNNDTKKEESAMTIVKCTPNRSVIPFASAINQVFDDFLPGFFGRSESTPTVNFRPSVDIVEQEDKILLRADMPGLDKGNIKVTVDDGLLTIEGTRNETRKETDKGYVRNERFVGTFSRSFNLPAWADAAKIGADYKNGVLEVTIPKTEAAKPKEIDIKVS
jgi:HSP20 family protein